MLARPITFADMAKINKQFQSTMKSIEIAPEYYCEECEIVTKHILAMITELKAKGFKGLFESELYSYNYALFGHKGQPIIRNVYLIGKNFGIGQQYTKSNGKKLKRSK